MSALQRAIDVVGGMGKLAELCGVRYQAVQKWRAKGAPPVGRVLDVERHTGISRHELRPDIYPQDSA